MQYIAPSSALIPHSTLPESDMSLQPETFVGSCSQRSSLSGDYVSAALCSQQCSELLAASMPHPIAMDCSAIFHCETLCIALLNSVDCIRCSLKASLAQAWNEPAGDAAMPVT